MCKLHIASSQFTQITSNCWGLSVVTLAIYFDEILPFALRSAPKIFTAVLDATGTPGMDNCQCNISTILDKCATLGVPIAAEKLVGPSSCLTFLGIGIDTEEGVLHLPAKKLARIQGEINRWSQQRVSRRHQL